MKLSIAFISFLLAVLCTEILDFIATVNSVHDLGHPVLYMLGVTSKSVQLTMYQAVVLKLCTQMVLIVMLYSCISQTYCHFTKSGTPAGCSTPSLSVTCDHTEGKYRCGKPNEQKTPSVILPTAVLLMMFFVFWIGPGIILTAVEDAMINQEFVSPRAQALLSMEYVDYGVEEMKNSDITIVGVTRNSADRLADVLGQVESLGKEFKYSQAVFIEGDSEDGTLKLLNDWAAESPANRTVANFNVAHAQETVPNFNGTRLSREGRLALVRNKLLGIVKALPKTTKYLAVLDLDIIGWNPLGVRDTFGRKDWDVMCANGIIVHGIYRDTYAFRTKGIDNNHHRGGDDHDLYNISEEQRVENRRKHAMAKKSTQNLFRSFSSIPLEVDSCFGGMAIYRTSALHDCKYAHRSQLAPYMLDCEHTFLHECIKNTYKGKIYANPNMKLWYGHTNLRGIHLQKLFS